MISDYKKYVYQNNDKRKLYWIIDLYLSNKINARSFCNEFYYCYDLELDSGLLASLEQESFSELSMVSNRFSPYKEDHNKCPGTYSTEEELKQLVIKIRKKLKKKFDEIEEEIKEKELFQI